MAITEHFVVVCSMKMFEVKKFLCDFTVCELILCSNFQIIQMHV